MAIQNIDVEATLDHMRGLMSQEKDMSPALKAGLELLLMLVTLMANRLGLNRSNSFKRPSFDPNRVKRPRVSNGRKPGAQDGHAGKTLGRVEGPR